MLLLSRHCRGIQISGRRTRSRQGGHRAPIILITNRERELMWTNYRATLEQKQRIFSSRLSSWHEYILLSRAVNGMHSDNHDMKKLVESGYDRIAERYLAWGSYPSPRLLYLQQVLDRLPDGAQVLELGCGA